MLILSKRIIANSSFFFFVNLNNRFYKPKVSFDLRNGHVAPLKYLKRKSEICTKWKNDFDTKINAR